MGLDITALIVDWAHLEGLPVDEREEALTDAAYPDDDDGTIEEGWVWLPPATPAWCARYEFAGTAGSFKPHFWTGNRWEDFREYLQADLRMALDTFLAGLTWDLPDTDRGPQHEGGPEHWYDGLLVYCPPRDIPALAQAWAIAGLWLEELREPFDTHAAAPGRWAGTFEEFIRVLHGWAEAVGEAHQRGWGLGRVSGRDQQSRDDPL
ncbi:hypothetical protein AB0F13_25125 [Streptomyces sp. NPDC026206]|uniref:hypothetical protein n=1 Tax=Streptomyces sp. NPDC026206 TaxID=3157089 RepID=UPI00340F0BAB